MINEGGGEEKGMEGGGGWKDPMLRAVGLSNGGNAGGKMRDSDTGPRGKR